MLGPWLVSTTALGYIGLLFAIAFYGDRGGERWRRGAAEPAVYALSLAIYCTSWTYYGSVGRAASVGIDFIFIYVGPILVMTLGYPVLRKIMRTAHAHNVTSVADFLGGRYGKSQAVAALATVIALVGVLPYIALQLQAVSLSFDAVVSMAHAGGSPARIEPFWRDTAFYVSLAMAAFSILFGVRHVHASERHQGLIMAIAFESLIKLGAFLAVGVFVVFAMFHGPGDLERQILANPALPEKATGFQPGWISITLVAGLAFVCLPRQFHVAVVESGPRSNLKTAAWLFPLYLLAINLFVPAIAAAGLLLFPNGGIPDLFVLLIPMSAHQPLLSLAVFVGGLSASTSMVIVESVALSTMICNELIVPALLRAKARPNAGDLATGSLILTIRRLAILLILLAAYLYHTMVGHRLSLAAIGLISFCAVAQCAPALLAGLYWPRAHRLGALAGMGGGALVWAYALLLPSLSEVGWASPVPVQPLPMLFGRLDPLSNGILWSLAINAGLLIAVSLLAGRRQPDGAARETTVWTPGAAAPADSRGHAALDDLKRLAWRILGTESARRAFAGPVAHYPLKELTAFTERLLSGAVGAASARIMIAAVLRRHSIAFGANGTLLREASEAILFNRDLLRATLENISQGIGMFDPQLRLAAWNRRLLELLAIPDGLARVGTPLADIVDNPQRRRTGRDVDLAMLAADQHCSEGRTRPHTYQKRRADGGVIELQTNPMMGGGFVLVCTDVTESVQALEALRDREQRIRVYTDNVPVLITYIDREERYRFTNEPYRRALGQHDAIGRSLTEVLGELRYRRLKPHIDAALGGQRQSFEIDFPNTSIEVARGTYIPHFDEAGNVLGFFTLYQDITEQRHAERVLREANETLELRVAERTRELTLLNSQLAKAKQEAEAANIGKTRFLAAASHDLLQPLHVARILTGTLAERCRSTKTLSLVHRVEEALGQTDSLLQALLEISKLDAGVLEPQRRPVAIGDLLNTVAASFEPMARSRGLEVRVVRSSQVVLTDPALLRRILQNLVSNAIRYTPSGRVLIGCRHQGGQARIEIWDTGMGIPQDQLGLIFEEFRRGPGDSETPPGLGLGLAIVERIAGMLEHSVSVRSWPDRGSVFSVSLPIGRAAPAPSPPAVPARIRSSVAGKRVLCVDNEPSVLSAMRTILEGWSCLVMTAQDEEAALRHLRETATTPDIILMDYHLNHQTTGLVALAHIEKELGRKVPAILITANHTDAVRDQARARGYAILNKPLKPGALRAAMAQLTASAIKRTVVA